MADLDKTLVAWLHVRIPQELATKLENKVRYNGQKSDIIREAIERHLAWLDAQDTESKKKVISILSLVGK